MKKIFVFLAIFTFSFCQMISQDVYSSILSSGDVKVFTLEWLSEDTLQISVTERSSQSGDAVFFYNLTSITGDESESEITFEGGDDTKFIPFDDPDFIATSDYTKVTCNCLGTGACLVKYIPVDGGFKFYCGSDPEIPCLGGCSDPIITNKEPMPTPVDYYQGGILVEAEYVIIDYSSN